MNINEKIEFFGFELHGRAVYNDIDENCKSLFDAILDTLNAISNLTPDEPENREIIETFQVDYEMFIKLKDIGKKEGIL
jgi:hypothetical protein